MYFSWSLEGGVEQNNWSHGHKDTVRKSQKWIYAQVERVFIDIVITSPDADPNVRAMIGYEG